MSEQERALYRYLTLWADFTHSEALAAIGPQKSGVIHRGEAWRSNPSERIYCQMEQDKNRRAA